VSGTPFAANRVESELAGKLLDALARPAFSAERFTNGAAERLNVAVARKVAGKEIVVPPPRAGAEVLDLEESLRASVVELGAGPGTKKAPASRLQPRRRARAS
jgi:non-homologous end joining protein Ku